MSVDYDNINSVLSIFDEQAHQYKEKPYLWRKINDKYASLSWSEVHDQVCKIALALTGLGILNGDRVIIVSENRTEWQIRWDHVGATFVMQFIGDRLEYFLFAGIIALEFELALVHVSWLEFTSIR